MGFAALRREKAVARLQSFRGGVSTKKKYSCVVILTREVMKAVAPERTPMRERNGRNIYFMDKVEQTTDLVALLQYKTITIEYVYFTSNSV